MAKMHAQPTKPFYDILANVILDKLSPYAQSIQQEEPIISRTESI